jgi:hypothetical protein
VRRNLSVAIPLILAAAWSAPRAAAQPAALPSGDSPQVATGSPFQLGPPNASGPVSVQARFELHDVDEINDEAETFQFTGVMTLIWHDPRQAFDPSDAGVNEKVFQGQYQFNEISTGWYPQVVLVNESGLYQKSGVVLRVQPDGTSTLIETVNAIAKAEFNMRRFPFDSQQIEAIFEVLGFGQDEVVMSLGSDAADSWRSNMSVPQWTVQGTSLEIRERSVSHVGRKGISSALVVGVAVQRKAFFVIRLVVIPLAVIVLLSFSVFWMDRSSLGDRINVSFIGILTGVAYQIVMSDILPHISYFTLMHGFLNLSFFTMCATVVINLIVGTMDQRGHHEIGDRLDHRCRWIFPCTYFGLNLVMLAGAFLFF